MCLIVFAYKINKNYPLILLSNRDEFYARPTQVAQFWQDDNNILAGRDLVSGGTWLGIHTSGKWGALSNSRSAQTKEKEAPSRGGIIVDYLQGHTSAKDFVATLKQKASSYNPFNLLVGDLASLYYFSSNKAGFNAVSPGIHALSNAYLDTPWPKVELVKKLFSALDLSADPLPIDAFFNILTNDTIAADEQLPNTGLGKNIERAISPIYIHSDKYAYGTRASTVLIIHADGKVYFAEKIFNTAKVKSDIPAHEFTRTSK